MSVRDVAQEMQSSIGGLYFVTTDVPHLGRTHESLAAAAIAGGARVVQYRDKRAGEHRLQTALAIRDACRRVGALFIVNDDALLAVEAGADGLHVGQSDLDGITVWRRRAAHGLLGISVSSVAEAREAVAFGADYVGAGPVYATGSKDDAAPPIGAAGLRAIRASIDLPIAAIGGISADNAADVLAAGADAVCVISAIAHAENPSDAARRLAAMTERGSSELDARAVGEAAVDSATEADARSTRVVGHETRSSDVRRVYSARSRAASLLPPRAVLERVAEEERIDAGELAERLLEGWAVVLGSRTRVSRMRACAVGAGLRTKVNANIGTSALSSDLGVELTKLENAVDAGADAVMDLSTGGDIRLVRKAVLERATVPVGTVPVYEAAVQAAELGGGAAAMSADAMIAAVRRQAEEGVDFQTIHASITRGLLGSGAIERRTTGIVSRGGALLSCWMHAHDAENPYFERFDEVLDICREHGVTVSLGDSLRPGCLADAGDEAQMTEVEVIGGLVRRALDAGVRVIVEGPGHVPLDHIAYQIETIKQACHGVPLYVLGPLVTDVAPGYDHITSAIGGTVAAMSGADFLCYVTRAEHVCLPAAEDVREGVVASRIAAHAGDVAAGIPGARERDDAMARARKALDWKEQFALAVDPVRPAVMRDASDASAATAECTMCGSLCSMRMTAEGVDAR